MRRASNDEKAKYCFGKKKKKEGKKMKLGVVIVTYNRIELLKECIANCMNQTLKFDKIFVINTYRNTKFN